MYYKFPETSFHDIFRLFLGFGFGHRHRIYGLFSKYTIPNQVDILSVSMPILWAKMVFSGKALPRYSIKVFCRQM